jgi:hypothetical protein
VSVTRFLTRWLWSSPRRSPGEFVAFQRRAYDRAMLVVRIFYGASAVWAVQVMNNRWLEYSRLERAEPLWPAQWWFDHVSVHTGVTIIFTGYVVSAVLAFALPQLVLTRLAYSVFLFQYMAFINGFDKINHDLHAWFFVSVVLILLPNGRWMDRARIASRQYFITVIWVAQLVVLFTYTLTGLWKVLIGIRQFAEGDLSAFHVSGFSYIVANRVASIGQETVLGDFFVRNEVLGWALFLGTMIVESVSIIIAFRPRLHRAWGVLLVLFHMGTQLVLGFTFVNNMFLLVIILVCSPLAPDKVSVKDAVLDLPGVHFVARRVAAVRSRTPPPSAPTPPPEPLATVSAD